MKYFLRLCENQTSKGPSIFSEHSFTSLETFKLSPRSIFSPIFTSGKMKTMKLFMDAAAEKLVDIFEARVRSPDLDGIVDLKDLFGRFSMDTIASCAFGLNSDSFSRSDPGHSSELGSNCSTVAEHTPAEQNS